MSNEQIIWDSFKSRGLNDFAVAGIIGNLFAESGLRPDNLQNSYEKKLGMSDAEYTAAVDNGSYDNTKMRKQRARGIGRNTIAV